MSLDHSKRYGRFTSSEIYKLLTKGKAAGSQGKPAQTYIRRKKQERALGRSLSTDVQARPLDWGHLLETRCFDILPTAYSLNSSDTLAHPEFPELWAGTPDGFRFGAEKAVVSIKCPYTLESFCDLVEGIQMGLTGMDAMQYIRDNHDDGEKFYWQILSDACIAKCDYGELIIYMPFESELAEIKLMAENTADRRYYFIYMALDGELPFIPDGGKYSNINIIRFQIPESDKYALTAAVQRAGQDLIDPPSVLIASSIPEGVMIENG
jgi:hypothetical protein